MRISLLHLFALVTGCGACALLLSLSTGLAVAGALLLIAFAVGQRWRRTGAGLFVISMIALAVFWLQLR